MDPNIKKRPANVNPNTGTPYGAIALNTLDQDIVETLQYGAQAQNLTYLAAKADYLAQREREDNELGAEFDYDAATNDFAEQYEGHEEVHAGKYEDVLYETFWLGGALHLFVFHSPFVRGCRPCSPCVPNAGDLNSEGGYIAYDVPPEWRAKE